MYKIIVSDLDETLLGADKSVSEENRAAIRAVRDMGVRFVPASGRGYRSMDKTLKELDLRQNLNINIAAIRDSGGYWRFVDPDEMIKDDSSLLVVMDKKTMNEINANFERREREKAKEQKKEKIDKCVTIFRV